MTNHINCELGQFVIQMVVNGKSVTVRIPLHHPTQPNL